MIEHIIPALSYLLTLENLIFMNIGMFVGIIFGAIPGINGNLAITILLPFTFVLNPVPALLMLTSIFFGANFGGSISAVLINTPGTGNAAATLLDGYPLSKRGFPRKSLDMALTASTFGGFVSAFCLLFFAPQISKIAMKIRAPEYFALAILGLSIIASVSGKSIIKGLISGSIGMLIALVGIDPNSGLLRFVFGVPNLFGGIKMMAVLLGVYAVSQMISWVNNSDDGSGSLELKKTMEEDRLTRKDIKATFLTMVKSSFIGAAIGAMPGAGGNIAAFVSYNEAKRCAKPGERFGEGELKGIAAPESANNGATAAALIPLLTLGIPGDAVSATLMGAFTIQGLVVGPRLFDESGPVIYAIMLGIVVSQIFIFFQGKYLMALFVKIIRVPQNLLVSLLMMICCTGAFAMANMTFDMYVMIFSGIAGYFMRKIDLPPVPVVLGIILGPIAESNLRNSLVLSGGSWLIFFKRPICLAFMLITVVLLVLLKRNEAKQQRIMKNFAEKQSEKSEDAK
jgi:putative tricarboxylic transport membrane protein